MFRNGLLVVTIWTILMNYITAEVFNEYEESIALRNLIRENQEFGSVRFERFCSASGIMCKNCTTTVLCIEIDDGVFEEYAADKCPSGLNCLETKCVEPTVNPHCSKQAEIPFVCSSVGMFPDQLDCRKYHLCVPTIINNKPGFKNYDAECSAGYKYNSKTTYCDKKLVSNRCFDNISQFPIPMCLKNGVVGVVIENPTIFYVCEYYVESPGENETTTTTTESTTTAIPENPLLYPFLNLCAHGKIFDPELRKCVG